MGEVVLVTGGGGFLGRRVVELLLERGDEVRFVARGTYPEVEALGAVGRQVDLRDAKSVRDAVRGVDVVHHVAGKAGAWGPAEEYASINVDGTRNVIAACKAEGVGRLVYTSTPSVIGYAHDAEGIEEAPYPARWESAYGETKARAERAVLAANGEGLRTVSLRPHLVIGPRDTNLVPRVIERAKAGSLRIVGDGTNKVDLTYVDNAAGAHLDAADALRDPSAPCAGRAYFISNDEPVVLWDWVNDVLQQLGLPPVTKKVSMRTAAGLGAVMEFGHKLLGGEPRMTRFMAVAMARSHWYSMAPAKRDLGYRIRVPLAEGTARTVAWLREAGYGA
ncbi:MAG: NAD-dependent epimerase/dehydratase family protein [Myxococcota bacterium]